MSYYAMQEKYAELFIPYEQKKKTIFYCIKTYIKWVSIFAKGEW